MTHVSTWDAHQWGIVRGLRVLKGHLRKLDLLLPHLLRHLPLEREQSLVWGRTVAFPAAQKARSVKGDWVYLLFDLSAQCTQGFKSEVGTQTIWDGEGLESVDNLPKLRDWIVYSAHSVCCSAHKKVWKKITNKKSITWQVWSICWFS